MNLEPGEHIRASRGAYFHHGIYVGDGQVVHYTIEGGGKAGAVIRVDPLDRFASGRRVEIVRYARRFAAAETIGRAVSRLGENAYHLYGNNCEHFARWCVTGEHRSRQVEGAVATAGGLGTASAAAAGGVAIVSAIGTGAALGGAAIMSGLARAGSAVGAGSAGGVAVLGALPALATTIATHTLFRDEEVLDPAERRARRIARGAATAAGVAGLAGSVGLVAAAGLPGLSGAGIASGLAGIGKVFGGGMKVGVFVVGLIPALAVLGIGVLAYHAALRSKPDQAGYTAI